ncbi:MAG: hypothetical protein NC098_03890 [Lachnoclostridium sp.]|nr:hypothetical protein [Lachnoclostridium sp.]
MDREKVVKLLKDSNIKVGDFHDHGKASECYVYITFIQDDGFSWETVVPYVNRRAGLFIESEENLVAYLKSIKPYFQKSVMQKWKKAERRIWEQSKAHVTKEFFYALLTFKPVTKFPPNNNPARRIQDIKDAGYTIATISNYCDGKAARFFYPFRKPQKWDTKHSLPNLKQG